MAKRAIELPAEGNLGEDVATEVGDGDVAALAKMISVGVGVFEDGIGEGDGVVPEEALPLVPDEIVGEGVGVLVTVLNMGVGVAVGDG